MPATHSKDEAVKLKKCNNESAALKNTSLKQSYAKVLNCLTFSEKLKLGGAFIGMFGSSANNLLFPYLTKLAIAGGSPYFDASNDKISFLIAALSILGCGAVFGWLRVYLFTNISYSLTNRIRHKMFHSIIKQKYLFRGPTVGSVMPRFIEDSATAGKFVTTELSGLIRSCSSIISGMVAIFSISPSLTLLTLGIVSSFGIVRTAYSKYIKKLRAVEQTLLDTALGHAEERISGLQLIRQFAEEDREIESFSNLLMRTIPYGTGVAFTEGVFMGSLSFMMYSTVVLILLYGGNFLQLRHLSAGSLTSFTMYSGLVALGFTGLLQSHGTMVKSCISVNRVFEIIDMEESPLEEGIIVPKVECGLMIKDLTFRYPEQPEDLLRSVSLSINEGEIFAITGPSGAGKTTLFNLINRLYDSTEGAIYLGGSDISKMNPKWLRTSVFGIVNQDPQLFSGSIRDNITYGMEATSEAIEYAAGLANAHTFINELPDKYETKLGRNGHPLSKGQKQRICIARMLIRNPPFCLLDEATSALDGEAEEQVHTALERVMEGRTVLMIAHRESTLRFAHRIAMLKDGQIQMVGTFPELCQNADFVKLLRGNA